ncbi:MAG: glycosyltransferase family 2 protein [Lachnospiraceae bacterium]|nr:glycosyltransferase family 2 protein [Lachnospiraceae bacterium]
MSNIKISVIMPVYKVEDYVAKAIESILTQTFTEFEFLIVDDGTPDRSGKICDEFAEKDSRIHVIHKENGGAPSARNTAIDIAKGKYVYFLDSDDWAEPEMLADMYALAEKNEAHLVVCGYFIDTYYGDRYISEKIFVDDRIYTDARAFREESYRYFDRNMLYTPWNKLYRMDLIKNHKLRFPDTLWDDFPFNLSYLAHVERVVFSTNAYYHFIRARAESETSAYRADMYEKREEEQGWMEALYKEWGVDNEGTKEMVARRYIERMIGCIANVTSSKCTLTGKERRTAICKMLHNPRVDQALRLAKPRSGYMKLMLIPIRLKNTYLTWLESALITFVKERNTKLFAKLKAGR